jgi:tetratricopeptide (TPR) repeat protein
LRDIIRIAGCFILLCWLPTGFTATGCSESPLKERARGFKKWLCDKEADEAIKRKDYERGISLHERLVRKEPDNALALYHLGYAYGHMGDQIKEASCYEKAIALGYKESHIFFNLAMAYREMNRIDESIKAFKKAIEIDPNNAEYFYELAMAYDEKGEEKRAEEALLKALEIDPEHDDARLFLQRLLERNKPDKVKEEK